MISGTLARHGAERQRRRASACTCVLRFSPWDRAKPQGLGRLQPTRHRAHTCLMSATIRCRPSCPVPYTPAQWGRVNVSTSASLRLGCHRMPTCTHRIRQCSPPSAPASVTTGDRRVQRAAQQRVVNLGCVSAVGPSSSRAATMCRSRGTANLAAVAARTPSEHSALPCCSSSECTSFECLGRPSDIGND